MFGRFGKDSPQHGTEVPETSDACDLDSTYNPALTSAL